MTMVEFWDLAHGETIYLYEPFYEQVFKVNLKEDIDWCFGKYKGCQEYKVYMGSEKMENSMSPNNLVTKEFYDQF